MYCYKLRTEYMMIYMAYVIIRNKYGSYLLNRVREATW